MACGPYLYDGHPWASDFLGATICAPLGGQLRGNRCFRSAHCVAIRQTQRAPDRPSGLILRKVPAEIYWALEKPRAQRKETGLGYWYFQWSIATAISAVGGRMACVAEADPMVEKWFNARSRSARTRLSLLKF
jgi:hypothetical protein